jgi:cyclopropane-fatty-acyl-phospholipid synthase
MNATTVSTHPLSLRAASSASRIDRFARQVLLNRFGRLQGGRIELVDPFGRVLLGTAESDTGPVRVTIHDLRFYREVVRGGGLAVADAYIRGLWDADDLTGLLRIFVRNITLTHTMDGGLARLFRLAHRAAHRFNRNSLRGSRRNIHAHYDLGNPFFELMLDDTMTYSCGIFESAQSTMREASIAKLDRICRKLDLKPHHHLLEIGTGWGSFAMHAARHYGCRVTTTTISKAQYDYATQRIADAGLNDRITVLLKDYRKLSHRFDRVASIEMIEAVGHAYLPTYFERCARLLKSDGQMMLQAITMPDWRYDDYRHSVDFIQRYVFPGSCCPSISAMAGAIAQRSDLRISHLEDLSPHYARTLRTWRDAFHTNLDAVRELGYDESFIRLWSYYLRYCEAGFAERYTGVVQMLLTKPQAMHAPILPSLDDARNDVP